jgi:hypothetical protein
MARRFATQTAKLKMRAQQGTCSALLTNIGRTSCPYWLLALKVIPWNDVIEQRALKVLAGAGNCSSSACVKPIRIISAARAGMTRPVPTPHQALAQRLNTASAV